jgi:hypothetical protein
MYDFDMQVPSHVDPAQDGLRDNQNANWREPLTRKNATGDQNRPGGGTIYGTPRKTQTLEECPVPTDFPWKRVFAKRETFLTPLKTFIEQIPEWADKNVPENPSIEIPKDIRDAMYLMYSRRKNNLPGDASSLAKAWTSAIKSAYDLKTSWDIMRARPTDVASRAFQGERWWGTSLNGVPMGSNPSFIHNMILGAEQTTTDLCINMLLNPYECCTDTATAYECCFGLIGCIPPPPLLNLTRVENLDEIANATCNGATNVALSMFFLPRIVFGTWLWTLIFMSPTWLRTVEFRVLYPLVYDYGGLGISEHFLGDLFCFIVNLYYPILVVLICFGLYILDSVFLQTWRDIVMKTDIAVASVSAAKAQEYSQVHIQSLESQVQALEQQMSNMQNRHIQ